MGDHAQIDGKFLCGAERGYPSAIPEYTGCMACRQVLLDRLPDGPWQMFAHLEDGVFRHVGNHRLFTKAHGDGEIHQVQVSIREDGLHWGWQSIGYNNSECSPSMIFPNEIQFKVCFPYGYPAEVEAKKGRVLRLHVELAGATPAG